MIRVAALSDIHGNLLSLEAVVADIQAQGTPDAIWVLGDLVAFFPWPAETLARLQALPNVAFLRGNTDRFTATGTRPALPVRSVEDWQRFPVALAVRDANFRWTVERLSYADYQFLTALPEQLEMDVPGYGRVAAVHGAPGDDEARLYPNAPDKIVRPYLAGLDARVLLGGHTHLPNDRVVEVYGWSTTAVQACPSTATTAPATRCSISMMGGVTSRSAASPTMSRPSPPSWRGWSTLCESG